MKKTILILLVAILLLSSLSACGSTVTLNASTRWNTDVNETIAYNIRLATFDEQRSAIKSPDLATVDYSQDIDQYIPLSCSGTYTTTLTSAPNNRYSYSTNLILVEIFDKSLFDQDLIDDLTALGMIVATTEDTISVKTTITTTCVFENTLAPVSSSRNALGIYMGKSGKEITSYTLTNTYSYGAKNKNECTSVLSANNSTENTVIKYTGNAYDNEMLFLLARCYCDDDNIVSGVTASQVQVVAPLVNNEALTISIAPIVNSEGKYLYSTAVASGVWADCYTMQMYPSNTFKMYAVCDSMSGNNVDYEGLVQYHLPIKLQQGYLVFEIDTIVSIEGLATTYASGSTVDSIDLTNAKLIFYANSNQDSTIASVNITADMISDFDTATTGNKSLTISYSSIQYTFDYTVI
ncbi:MAG: hypothetical protein PHW00_03430 [Clostridia bacterium]|nr:hypothetical protein [Clostridia bacterium]